jgi:predicted RNA-binding protein
MCLAKAYVRSAVAESEGKLIMENVTRVEVDGERVHLTSLLGDTEELQARITFVSFIDSKLVLETAR